MLDNQEKMGTQLAEILCGREEISEFKEHREFYKKSC